ncbi:hypothetical protein JCM10207_007512 [Rhodosporidiobolus poonsookiae]
MPKPQEPDKIPITSSRDLHVEVEALLSVLALNESEDTWEKINKAVKRFQAVVRGGATKLTDDFTHAMRDPRMVKGLTRSLATERGALSGTALELVASCTRLGAHFAALLHCYLPTVLRLLAKPNKVYITRAASCLSSIIKNTHLADVIKYIVLEWRNEAGKSATFREQAAGAVALILGVDGGELLVDKEHLARRVEDLEWVIKTGATGREVTVRADMKKCWEVYKREWPERVASFTAPMTPTIRKYLKITEVAGGASAAPAPSRPPPAKKAHPLSTSTGPSASHSASSRAAAPPTSRSALAGSTTSRTQHAPPLPTASTDLHASVGMGMPSHHRPARAEPSRSASASTTSSSRSASRAEDRTERDHLSASTTSSSSAAAAHAPARSGFKPTAPSTRPAGAPARLAPGPKHAARAPVSSNGGAPAEPRKARRVAAPPPAPTPAPVPTATPGPAGALSRSQGASTAPPAAAALARSQGTASAHAPFRPKLTASTAAAAAGAVVKPTSSSSRAALSTSTSSASTRPASSAPAHKPLASSTTSSRPAAPPVPSAPAPRARAPLHAPTASSRARAKDRAASPDEARKPAPSASASTASTATLAARERRERRAAEAAALEAQRKRDEEAREERERAEREERERLERAREVPLPPAAQVEGEEEESDLDEQDDEAIVEEEVREVQEEEEQEKHEHVEHVELVVPEAEEDVEPHAAAEESSTPIDAPAAEIDVEVSDAPAEADAVAPDEAELPVEADPAVEPELIESQPEEAVGMDSDLVLESAPASQEVEEQEHQYEQDEEEERESEEQAQAAAFEPVEPAVELAPKAAKTPEVAVEGEAEEHDEEDTTVDVEEDPIRLVRNVPPSPFIVAAPVASPPRSVAHPAPAARSPSPPPPSTFAFDATPSPIATSGFVATSTPAPISHTTRFAPPIASHAPFTPPHLASATPVVHFPSATFPAPLAFAPASPEPWQTCSIILDTPPRFDELPGAVRLPGRVPVVALPSFGRPAEVEEPAYVDGPVEEKADEEDYQEDTTPSSPSPHSPLAARKAPSPPVSATSVDRPPMFFPDVIDHSAGFDGADTSFGDSDDEQEHADKTAHGEEEMTVEEDSREFDVPLNDTSAYNVVASPALEEEYDDSDSEAASTPAARSAQATPVPAPAPASQAKTPIYASSPAPRPALGPSTYSFADNDTLDLAAVFAQQKAQTQHGGFGGSPRLMEDESAIFELERPELRFHDDTEESETYDTTLERDETLEAPFRAGGRRVEAEPVEATAHDDDSDDSFDCDVEEEQPNVLKRSLRSRVVTVDLSETTATHKTPARAATRMTRSTRKAQAVLERDILGEMQA